MLKLVYLCVLIWLVYKLVQTIRRPSIVRRSRPTFGPRDGRIEAGELVQDPQCGVYIPRETALKGPGGEYFCSEKCREAHRAEAG